MHNLKNEKTPAEGRDNGPQRSRARVTDATLIRKATDLLDLIQDKDQSDAIKVLRRGLKATKTYWSTVEKRWVKGPDFKERRETAALILAYSFGKPIERQITATGTFSELKDLLARVYASPEARRELGDIVPPTDHATN